MMTYEVFKENLKTNLSELLEEKGHSVKISDVTTQKANITLDGLSIRLDDATVAPTIYTQSCFEQYKSSDISIPHLAERLADTVETSYIEYKNIGFNPKGFDADFLRKNAYIAVVNTARNKDLLSTVPHMEVPGTDLSAYAKVHVGNNASITIKNDHAFQFGMTGTEILEVAKANTIQQYYSIKSMQETLLELIPAESGPKELFLYPEEEHPSMVVITNETKYDGANCIISKEALDATCEKMGCNIAIILPSSRHELIAVDPERLGLDSTNALKDMVGSVNATEVSAEDFLSDNIYRYDSIAHELSLCNEQGLFPEHSISQNLSKSIGIGIA